MKLKLSLVILLLASVVGCAATRQAKVEKYSGFLGSNYSLLKEGTDDQAQLIYINPTANFSAYRKVWLAPIRVIRGKDSNLAEFSSEDLQKIADFTYLTFKSELKTKWQLVSSPQPGTLKIELAITDVDKSDAGLDTITSIIPQLRTPTALKGLISGKAGFVGEASGEGMISDASTGELLSAAVDRRVGTKNVSGVTNSWNDFEQAVNFWAKRFARNLCLEQGRSNCGDAPEA